MYTDGDLVAHNSKRHYKKETAKRLLKKLRSRGGNYKQRSIYKCPVCGLWCLTSLRKSERYNVLEVLNK